MTPEEFLAALEASQKKCEEMEAKLRRHEAVLGIMEGLAAGVKDDDELVAALRAYMANSGRGAH